MLLLSIHPCSIIIKIWISTSSLRTRESYILVYTHDFRVTLIDIVNYNYVTKVVFLISTFLILKNFVVICFILNNSKNIWQFVKKWCPIRFHKCVKIVCNTRHTWLNLDFFIITGIPRKLKRLFEVTIVIKPKCCIYQWEIYIREIFILIVLNLKSMLFQLFKSIKIICKPVEN